MTNNDAVEKDTRMINPTVAVEGSPSIDWRSIVAPGVFAWAWYWIVSVWFPLREGRDFVTWFRYFQDFLRVEPDSVLLMLYRTPLTPLFYGLGFEAAGQIGLEIILSLLFAVSVVAVFLVINQSGRVLGWLTIVLACANLWAFRCYNSVGSETLQTVLLCIWFCLAFFSMGSKSRRLWAGLGFLVFLMVMNRPANQVFVLSGVLPLLMMRGEWTRRWVLCACFFVVYAALSFGYATLNETRYGSPPKKWRGRAHLV